MNQGEQIRFARLIADTTRKGRPDAVVHHEGLGAVFSRIAYLYTASFRRFLLDGPQGPHRQELGRTMAEYENLAGQLTSGRRRLPPSAANHFGRPGA